MSEKPSESKTEQQAAAHPEDSRMDSLRRAQGSAERAELHTLLLRMSNLFIRADQSQINSAIDAALSALGRFAEVSSSYLFEFDAAMLSVSKHFEWLAHAVPPTREAFTGVTADSMRNLFPQAAAGRILRVNALKELAKHEREQMQAVGVGAFLCVPVRVQGRVVGLLGFDHRGGGRVWTDAEELLLLLAADMFGQALDRRRTHNRLAFHVNNAPLGVVEWDRQWRVQRWSPMAERMFGWSAGEVIGREWASWPLVHEADVQDVRGVTNRLVSGAESSNVSVNRNHTKDGRTITCEWFNSVLRDAAGAVVSILSFVQDITERQRVQQELAESREALQALNADLEGRVELRTAELHQVTRASEQQARTLQAILDAGLDHVVLLDRQSRCVFVGRALLEDLGRSASGLIGRTAGEAGLPEAMARMFRDEARPVLEDGKPRYLETILDTTRGPRSFEYTLLPVFDHDDRPVQVLCSGHDITDRKRGEQLARLHREELAHVGRLSMMGEMASGLAHEINQPLAAINNYANGALRRIEKQNADPQDVANALRHVAEQSDRAGQIIRGIRGLVMKRGTVRAPERINGLVQKTLALLDADITDRRARVGLDLADDLPAIHVDGIQIEQVLLNVIRNALEAMDANAPEDRRLDLATRLGDARDVRVQITDYGPGLTESERDHLFDPFFSTKQRGMGMGLTISQSIVQAHGGRLWVTPGTAGGTTFHLSLPHVQDTDHHHPGRGTDQHPGGPGRREIK